MDAALWLSALLLIILFSAIALAALNKIMPRAPFRARLVGVLIGSVCALVFRAWAHAEGGPMRWDMSLDYLLPAACVALLVLVFGRPHTSS
jgi:hypothetical protein